MTTCLFCQLPIKHTELEMSACRLYPCLHSEQHYECWKKYTWVVARKMKWVKKYPGSQCHCPKCRKTVEWVLEPQGHYKERKFRDVWTPRRLKRMGTSLMTMEGTDTETETETDRGMSETEGDVSETGDDADSTEGTDMDEDMRSTTARCGSEEEDL